MMGSYCGAHTCHLPTHERLLNRITRVGAWSPHILPSRELTEFATE